MIRQTRLIILALSMLSVAAVVVYFSFSTGKQTANKEARAVQEQLPDEETGNEEEEEEAVSFSATSPIQYSS